MRTVCGIPRCPNPAVSRGRCVVHRQTTTQRGYGPIHQAVRRRLAAQLPVRCGYGCGTLLTAGSAWVAAHRVDGDPSAGYIVACPTCNERAKGMALVREAG